MSEQNVSGDFTPLSDIISILLLIIGTILIAIGVSFTFGVFIGMISLGFIFCIFGALFGYKS